MADARRWGIERGYQDSAGVWRAAPPATVDALSTAMGAGDGDPPPSPVVFSGPDRDPARLGPGHLEFEAGGSVVVESALPRDLPFGYHRFIARDGSGTKRIIGTPGRCRPPPAGTWGWADQLYATRSAASWGIGDLADLRRLAHWSAGLGAGLVLVSPLHAALSTVPQQPSPYFASSRCFRNPLYLRIEEIEGAGQLPDLSQLAAAGRALNANRIIDRDAVWRLKSAALDALFAGFRGDPDFDRYCREAGEALLGYATFCALGERFGFPWAGWPEGIRRPAGPGVAEFAASEEGRRRIRFHSWLQWLLDRQLEAASGQVGLLQDLAIGVDAGGADAWLWQDCFAQGIRVGAPPDEFNTLGQDWGMPPFDPWRLRTAGYEPFIQTVRAGLRHAGGLRFDHVMGLFRLFWIPEGGAPGDGAYVRYPWADLLDILALESHRAGAYVVGEDLGTIEPYIREELQQRGVLSYRLLWFEEQPPDRGTWPTDAMAAVTTHDLPTVAGLWSGADVAAQRALGLAPNEAGVLAIRDKVARWTGADRAVTIEDLIERTYRLLGRAPCRLLAATLDDALAVEERPNMPGTLDEWPNWSIALPQPLEHLETAPLALAIAAALNERGDGPSGSTSEEATPDRASGPGRRVPARDTEPA